jgi:hypothetical protein
MLQPRDLAIVDAGSRRLGSRIMSNKAALTYRSSLVFAAANRYGAIVTIAPASWRSLRRSGAVASALARRAALNAGASKGSFSQLCDRDLVEWTYGVLSVASDSIFVLGAIHQSEKQQANKQH